MFTFIHLAIAKVVSVLAASYLSSLLRLLELYHLSCSKGQMQICGAFRNEF